jgi:D-xylose transport system substrate-binding protein
MHSEKVFATLIISSVIISTIFQCGCTTKQIKNHTNDGKIVIGFSMDTLKEERWYKDRDGFVADAKSLGASVIVNIAYDSDAVQLKQVKDMLDKGIDVLVIIPHDAQNAASCVALAKRYGVKVISYDRLVRNAGADLYISFDNEKVGELMAKTMIAAVPQGNYVIVDGPASDYNSIMINQGIRAVLNPYINSGKINIAKEMATTDWMADEASSFIQTLLKNNTKIDAVIAENDSLAGGVITTLSQYQMIPDVPVVGMDADLAACQRVVMNLQLMTVYKPINQLTHTAAQFAVMMAKGEDINVSGRISDGKYSVPYYMIEPVAVNKDNMVNTVIKDGFHMMSEVYMNIPESNWPS